MSSFKKNDEDSIDNENNIIDILVEYVKDELLKSNIRYEIVKPILIYLLYYLIPFILFIILLNFISTIIAICIVFKYLL
uniref:Uncharacterized protein n=1 Tax=Virus NIOZ-UU159 TaxID=2763270 RepID=A0A7S9SUS3_9VIRU|nr:MAG: hypothetical protein NIOZUU159_00207 [Virus NIOZ-UU159]|tara:strand:- start:2186 stop:2422 length:237 start_codon:yes stop_codon:yes gene_type:complete